MSQSPAVPPSFWSADFCHKALRERQRERERKRESLLPLPPSPIPWQKAFSPLGIDIEDLHSLPACSLAGEQHPVMLIILVRLQRVKEWSISHIPTCRRICCYRSSRCTSGTLHSTPETSRSPHHIRSESFRTQSPAKNAHNFIRTDNSLHHTHPPPQFSQRNPAKICNMCCQKQNKRIQWKPHPGDSLVFCRVAGHCLLIHGLFTHSFNNWSSVTGAVLRTRDTAYPHRA